MTRFTVLLEGQPIEGAVLISDGQVRLEPDAAWASLGPAAGSGASLGDLALSLDRPLAVDVDEGAAFLGVSARVRRERLLSLEAPDFTLPDAQGRSHTLSAYRGRKVFLVAYASW